LNLDYTFKHPEIHDNIRVECLATRTAAALFNMSYFGKFYITGPDARKAVDWIFTNRMDAPIGGTIYTCMLNKNAGIEADLTVSMIGSGEGGSADPTFQGDGYYVAAAGGAAYQNLAHIQTVVQDAGFNVTIEDRSRDMGMVSLQGPKSRDILSRLTDTPLDNENFPFSTNKMIEVAGHKVRALRVSFVGELGWELHIPAESCVPVYRALMAAGEDYGIVNAGYRAIDSLSIEKGYPHWHQEVRMDDNPLEAGLLFTCKLKTDTDFLGRKALEEKRKLGARKKKVCLTVDDDVCLLGLEAIVRNGEYVGHVRRGDHAFFTEQEVAYGYVSNNGEKITQDWLKSGVYEIESYGKLYPATLHVKSPFDSANKRIQGNYEDPPVECLNNMERARMAAI
jgi:sarcosine dehydrogenase